MPEIEPKDRFDAYMKLAEFGQARFQNRQQYEFRVSFGLWAVLVAALLQFRVETLPRYVGFLIFIIHGLYILGLLKRHDRDRDHTIGPALASAKELVALCSQEPQTGPVERFYGVLMHLSITAVLLIAIYFMCAESTPWLGLIEGPAVGTEAVPFR